MSRTYIPIDFVAGAHGHFLEYILNRFFGSAQIDFDPFNKLGSSHNTSKLYEETKLFNAHHWAERNKEKLLDAPCIISIRFSQDDLLALSSVSLLRAGDMGIDNDNLEVNTFNKLNNRFYSSIITELNQAYPLLNLSSTNPSAPRSVLREFFKFSFKNPNANGYWIKQQNITYPEHIPVFEFKFDWFYDRDRFVNGLHCLESFLKQDFNFNDDFYQLHDKFLKLQVYRAHKVVCDQIISDIVFRVDKEIPKLTLLQESYINGCLENIYQKEMPFQQEKYFTNTKDVLQYLEESTLIL